MAKALQAKKNYQVQTTQNSFESGLIAQKLQPHIILVNLLAENIDATTISRDVRANQDLQGTRIIAIADALSDSEITALLQKGFDAFLPRNAPTSEVIRAIEEATAIIY